MNRKTELIPFEKLMRMSPDELKRNGIDSSVPYIASIFPYVSRRYESQKKEVSNPYSYPITIITSEKDEIKFDDNTYWPMFIIPNPRAKTIEYHGQFYGPTHFSRPPPELPPIIFMPAYQSQQSSIFSPWQFAEMQKAKAQTQQMQNQQSEMQRHIAFLSQEVARPIRSNLSIELHEPHIPYPILNGIITRDGRMEVRKPNSPVVMLEGTIRD